MVEDLVSRSSICITQHDPFDGRQRVHKGAKAVKDELEGRKYVHDCVKILLKTVTQENIHVVVHARLTMIQDQMIPSSGLPKVVALHRTITSDEKVLELTIPIWVMDEGNGVDDFPLSHSCNKGKTL